MRNLTPRRNQAIPQLGGEPPFVLGTRRSLDRRGCKSTRVTLVYRRRCRQAVCPVLTLQQLPCVTETQHTLVIARFSAQILAITQEHQTLGLVDIIPKQLRKLAPTHPTQRRTALGQRASRLCLPAIAQQLATRPRSAVASGRNHRGSNLNV